MFGGHGAANTATEAWNSKALFALGYPRVAELSIWFFRAYGSPETSLRHGILFTGQTYFYPYSKIEELMKSLGVRDRYALVAGTDWALEFRVRPLCSQNYNCAQQEGIMSASHLLLLSLLAAPGALAQSSANPQLPPDVLNLSPSTNTYIFTLPQSKAGEPAMDLLSKLTSPSLAKRDTLCFTMRTYHFSHDAQTEALKMDGYSTCQSEAKLQTKDATGSK